MDNFEPFASTSTNNQPQAFPSSTISEDTLHYIVHLPPNTKTSPEGYAALITARVGSLLAAHSPFHNGEWLWHKDAWELKVVRAGDLQDRRFEKGNEVPKVRFEDDDRDESGERKGTAGSAGSLGRKLEGRMRIGDSVDDEWLVVWLLRQVSEEWPEVMISIRDTDGDFLLIEAANHLPRWVTPTNATNRLWLAAGHLHLIPPDHRSAPSTRPKSFEFDQNDISGADDEADDDEHAWLNESDAARLLRRALTVISDGRGEFYALDIEKDVWARISGYPGTLKTHHQRSRAYLPVNIAKALKIDPSLGQRAVEGFYTRDAAQLRMASRATKFPPFPATSVVLSSLTLTRTAYAQLKGQVYHPPRVFGSEWRVSAPEEGVDVNSRSEMEREKKYRDLGVKMIMGFEIMYREDNKRSRRNGKAVELTREDLAKDKEYLLYLENLERAGWFGNEIKGSAGYKVQEKKAEDAWRDLQAEQIEDRTSFAQAVDDALVESSTTDVQDLATSDEFQEDSEAWLEVSPDELDGMLSQAEAGQEAQVPRSNAGMDGEDAEANEQAKVLGDLAKKVNSFVEAKGGMTGATFDDELSDEDMLGDSDDESDGEPDDGMTTEERDRRMGELVPGLAPEEWGIRTQQPLETATSTEKEAKPKVTFATGTKAPSKDKLDDMPSIRPPILEPEVYDGHIPESDDDMSDWDPADDVVGWAARPSYKVARNKNKKKRTIDPSTYVLQEALRTGQPMPRDNVKPFDVGDKLDLSDDEDEERGEERGIGEPDMEAEQDEFLKFAREALGINDEMWRGMMGDRKARGAYVPDESTPGPSTQDLADDVSTTRTQPTPTSDLAPGQRNPNLDSFERVMDAMEAELIAKRAKEKSGEAPQAAASTTKPVPSSSSSASAKQASQNLPSTRFALDSLPTEADLDDMDEDDLAAMDRELRAALRDAGAGDDDDEDEDMDDMDDMGLDDEMREALGSLGQGEKNDFKMMKDLLGSYKAQGGSSGVVGNLFRRLNEKK